VSFTTTRHNITFVACDLCERAGAVFDPDWREMGRDLAGEPIHLCRACYGRACWCAAHQRYHLPSDNHRSLCVTCGGLFTAQVAQQIEHCPSCRRTAAFTAPQPKRHTLWAKIQRHLPH